MEKINQGPGTSSNENTVDSVKKKAYFAALALHAREALQLHANEGGLWEKDTSGKRTWGNVSEHCIVEIARVKVLADELGLSQDAIRDLEQAAALHDFSKRKEKELPVGPGGITWEQYDTEISKWSSEVIREHGFNERVNTLANSVGHDSLARTEEILTKASGGLSEDEITYLVMHYVDNYTRGTDWVVLNDGSRNDIDARVEKDANNATLKNLKDGGMRKLDGRDYIEVMRVTGHQIETILTQIIKAKTGIEIAPLALPEHIDAEIKKTIAKTVV